MQRESTTPGVVHQAHICGFPMQVQMLRCTHPGWATATARQPLLLLKVITTICLLYWSLNQSEFFKKGQKLGAR